MSIYLDNDGDGSYDDSVGSMTGYNTARMILYGSISTIDAGTDCDDSDPNIRPSSTGVVINGASGHQLLCRSVQVSI